MMLNFNKAKLLGLGAALSAAALMTAMATAVHAADDKKTALPLNPALISEKPFSGSYIGAPEIDALMEKVMPHYDVPGMAVGILYKGKPVFLKGYGIREIGKQGDIDTETLFKIASNSKAFTTAALAQLVDEEKIAWDTPVVDILDDFKMISPWLTANITVADLLTHRAGLNSGAGDLMLWPEPSNFTRQDVVHALRYIKADKPFRAGYAYDNLLYIVAGEIIPAVTGKAWNEYVDQNLMQAMDLKHCFAGPMTAAAKQNMAAPHGVIEGELQVIERNRTSDDISLMAAAGGIRCSIADMMPWMQTQLNQGLMPSGERLYSEAQADEMWSPQVIRNVSSKDRERANTHFKSYGLGWRLADVHGYLQVSHTGSLSGTRSYVTLVPELDLGVVVLSNGSSSAARQVIMSSIVWAFMDAPNVDWQAVIEADAAKWKRRAVEKKELSISDAAKLNLKSISKRKFRKLHDSFTGRFVDPWFGEIEISKVGKQLVLQSKKSPQLRGELRYQDDNTLSVHWFDRTLEADAYVFYQRDDKGVVETVTMDLISNESDFSFDFIDLLFKPASE